MKLSHRRQTIRPKYVFATSKVAVEEKATIVVSLEHDGVVGLGEVVPSALYGQSLEASEAALEEMPAVLGDDPFAIDRIINRLIERFDHCRDAIAAVDSALYDWVGKKLNTPVWRILGLDRPRVRTTFTIGVADPDLLRVKVEEALEAGYDALKIKVGVENDHDTLTHIRNHFDGPLILDANQGWTPAEAADKIRALAPYKPGMIEQPLRKEDWRHMADLCKLGVAPIFADESCERPADVVRLHGCVDGVNIKFNKCGGIREALRMVTLARGLGMQVMLGCFVSSSLAIAPPLSIATLADYNDLDGALLLGKDPFDGIKAERSTIELGDAPGLGVWTRD
jgi:L-alanine-DL-glutamate epimerase-like enolase superfamily enzyme